MLNPRSRSRALAAVLVAVVALFGGTLVLPALAGAAPTSGAVGTPAPSSAAVPPDHLASVPLHPSNSTFTPVTSPSWLAYDTADHAFYIAAPPSSVDIVYGNDSPLGVNVTVGVGLDPFGVAFDNATGDIFVTNSGSDSVSVLSGTATSPLENISVGSDPLGVAYLSSNGYLYVANQGSDNVTVIDGATLAVVASVPVGAAPLGVAADPSHGGQIFVADEGSSSVSVIDAATDAVTATVPVGDEPYGVALDNRSDAIYVTNFGSNNVSVIAAATDSPVASIPVVWPSGNLQGIAYDPGDGLVWAGAGATYMVVIDPTNESVVDYVGTDPAGVAYDPDNGNVCVTNTANATFECIELPDHATSTIPLTFSQSGLPTGASWSVTLSWGQNYATLTSSGNNSTVWIMPWYGEYLDYSIAAIGVPYAPLGATGTVQLTGGTVSVTFFPDAVKESITFTETNLTPGDAWWVSFAGLTEGSSSASIAFTVPAANATYQVLPAPGLNPTPIAGLIAPVASSSTQNITFLPANASYLVEFYEGDTWYPSAWGVAVDGQSAATSTRFLYLYLEDGTYNFTAFEGAVLGGTEVTGSVTIAGWSVVVNVSFATTIPTYLVQFTETGLPSGIPWTVNLTDQIGWSNFSTIDFFVPNGTYWFIVYSSGGSSGTWVPTPNNGTVVVQGQSVTVTLSFEGGPSTYAVTFAEAGLRSGDSWSVNLSGTLESATVGSGGAGGQLAFTEPNGSYPFVVYAPNGSAATPSSGRAVVRGSDLSIAILFNSSNTSTPTVPTFAVGFNESGLPSNTSWSVTLGGTVNSSIGAHIGFEETNGTYNFTVGTVPGYRCGNGTRNLTVDGSSVAVLLQFSAATYPVEVTETGLPAGTSWTVTATTLAGAVAASAQSATTKATLELSNGTYRLSIAAPDGLTVVVSPSVVTVTGPGSAAASATFSAIGAGKTSVGVPVWIWETVAIVAVLASLVLLALLLASRRRPPIPTWWGPAPPPGGPPTDPPD